MNAAPVAIIGMHRSGTSCLAGCLEDLGLSLGEVNTSAPYNLKGNRENTRLWPLHDGILARVGAAWDEPPGEPVVWTREERAELRARLADYDGLPRPWGFKDPRATLLLDGWLEEIPDLRLAASFRHPDAVAASLHARNGFEPRQSHAIWLGYNAAVLRWRDVIPFALVDYDDEDYEVKVRAAARDLGLRSDAPMPFRSAELTHQRAGGPVPEALLDTWRRLSDAAA